MPILLVVVALLVAAYGLLSLTQATLGVGAICFACLLGILARIAQASAHTGRLETVLRNPGKNAIVPTDNSEAALPASAGSALPESERWKAEGWKAP